MSNVVRLISASKSDFETMTPMALKESIYKSEGRVIMGQHLLFALRVLYPLELCHKVQILLHGHFRVERRLLRQIAYTGFSLLRLLRQTEAGYLYLALGGRQIAGNDIHSGGFTCSIRP